MLTDDGFGSGELKKQTKAQIGFSFQVSLACFALAAILGHYAA